MRPSRAARPVFGAACLMLVAASACGSSKGSNVNGDGTSSGANGSGAGTSGTTGPVLGLAGESAIDNGGGSSAVGEECAGDLIQAQRIPLDMYVMLDVSGSMLEATAGDALVAKWTAVSSALSDFVSDPASDGIGVGLQVFPLINAAAPTTCTTDQGCGTFGPCLNRSCWPLIDGEVNGCIDDTWCEGGQTCKVIGDCSLDANYVCDTSATTVCSAGRGDCVVPTSVCLSETDCRSASYATPAADIAPLPGAKAALLDVIQGSMPEVGGLTPTGPALAGAIEQSKAWAAAHPAHQVVAVLVTDGLPTLQTQGQVCAFVTEAADITAVVNLAGTGQTGTPPVSTFVIGVLSPADVTSAAPDILDAMANAGGTDRAFVVNTQNNVQVQFRDALDKIRASGLSCELAVPVGEAGKAVDYGRVNVSFDNGAGATDLLSWPDASGCAAEGGWYYDVSPAEGTPQRIIACPTTCTAFQQTEMGSVQIKLGCKTRMVVK